MLNLRLRDEFLGAHMPGTAIALRRKDKTGAAEQGPEQILGITYPTADIQSALRAVGTNRPRRPVVLMGERGRGKSHIMAVMHHAVQAPDHVELWAKDWGSKLEAEVLRDLTLQRDFVAISEPVHNHEYPLLWDLIFDRHPKGERFRGKFEQMQRPYPPRSLLEEMFEAQPVALILDEFQKWFDGLSDQPGSEGIKYRTWAENFIQNLSELSKDRPDLLLLAVSVLNNNTEAFRQIHRDGPILIDFHGPTAKQDRQKLLLYRLFKNRENISASDIRDLLTAYADERFRLRFPHLSDVERARVTSVVVTCWPFSPELLELLEDHILMAEAAQETRDMIRILAQVFRARGEDVPLVTPADFFVDDDTCGVQSLIDSIATVGEQEHLREIAQRNLESVLGVGETVPHAKELVSSLWMRSMSPGRTKGGTRQELHLDITRDAPVDDNRFQGELVLLIENSINIHGEETPDGRLYFGLEDNPRSKVRSTAKNDKLWQATATAAGAGQSVYPGKDIDHIRNTLKHILVSETRQPASRVIILGPNHRTDPWSDVDDLDKPSRWDRPVLIAIPEPSDANGANQVKGLGEWLAQHVPRRRNTVRFLLPALNSKDIYHDPDLAFSARCSYLTSIAWKDDPKYRAIREGFDKPLRDVLRRRFDRFAVLRTWDYRTPGRCTFDVERIGAQGGDIPMAVEEKLFAALFDAAAFETLVLDHAKDPCLIGDLLDELTEPPPPGKGDTIPYLGDTSIHEEILKVAARGKIVLNVSGTWIGRSPEHAAEDEALRYVRSKAFRSGQEMRQIQMGLPAVVGGMTVTAPGAKPLAPSATTGSAPLPSGGPAPGETGTVVAPPTGGDGSSTPTPPRPATLQTKRTNEPNIGINLTGYFEKWGVPSSTILNNAKVVFEGLTVQQLKQILQRLPSSVKASLEISFPEEDK